MGIVELILISVGLAMDAFAVAVCKGLNMRKINYKHAVIIAAFFGLIPNCAASVALTTLCTEGLITVGTMLSGLFSGAGVGILVLFRINKRPKENLAIVGVILAFAVVFGLLGEIIFPTLI